MNQMQIHKFSKIYVEVVLVDISNTSRFFTCYEYETWTDNEYVRNSYIPMFYLTHCIISGQE